MESNLYVNTTYRHINLGGLSEHMANVQILLSIKGSACEYQQGV